MLTSEARDAATIARLREAWAAGGGNLRVERALDDGFAREAFDAACREPHEVSIPEAPPIEFLFWKWTALPEPDCDHTLCRLGRFIATDLLAWTEQITGLPLAPAPDGLLASVLWTKGSYLDAHDDWGRGRAVAYVIGLTEAPWDERDGGWLEFLGGQDGPVLERRPPGWCTIDLFDVREPGRWHRVPLLREHRVRRTIAGWFHPRPGA
jgi:hypothetical protein